MARTRPAPRAFISHISEEAEVAGILKAAVNQDFLGLLDVFLSSDSSSVQAGDDWLKSVDDALRTSRLMLVLCSRASINQPWINFEAGAAWTRNVPIVPLCHGGLAPSDLPLPLSSRQGVSLTDPAGLERLYARIARVIDSQSPKADLKALAAALAGAGKRVSRQTRRAAKATGRPSSADATLAAIQRVPSSYSVQRLECSLVLHEGDTAVLTRGFHGISVEHAIENLTLPVRIGVNLGKLASLDFRQVSKRQRLKWEPARVPGGADQHAGGRVLLPRVLTPGTKDVSFQVSAACTGGPCCRTEQQAKAFYQGSYFPKEYSGMLVVVPAKRLDVSVEFPASEATGVRDVEPVAFYGLSEENNLAEYVRIEKMLRRSRNGRRLTLTVANPLRGQVYGIAWTPPDAGR